MTIIARESDLPVIGEVEAMVKLLEERKNKIRLEEAEYNKLRDQILEVMIKHGIQDSVSTMYGMVTVVTTTEWEYRDGEVTRQEKAVSVAKKALDGVKKLLKTAQELAILHKKAKVVNVTHSLRYYEPK